MLRSTFLAGATGAAIVAMLTPATAQDVETVTVTAARLAAARNGIQTQTGASTYTITAKDIENQPGGDNAALNSVILQAPGVAQDSFGQLHVRGEHNGLQYRLNGIILPEGISVFGQTLDPRLAESVRLITGALPAEYGNRTAGIIDIQTKSGVFDNGGVVSVYGGSHSTLSPSLAYGGSSGNFNYFVSGDYTTNALGVESPDGKSDPLHDRTNQYHAFAFAQDILNTDSSITGVLGTSNARFEIPNQAGLQPTGIDGIVGLGPLNGDSGDYLLKANGATAFPSENLDERQREDAFYYYRDQTFGARDPLSTIKPPERRQQLGGSISGPIRANKLFYFINYDQQIRNFPLVIEDLTSALLSGKPTLPANPTAAQQATYNTQLKAFNAGAAYVLSQFPGGAPGNMQSRTMGNNIVLGKADYLINSSTTLSTFFNYMRSSGERAIQTPIVLGNVGRNGTDDVRIYSYNARLTSTLGPQKVNELRFQWSRDFEFEIADQPPPEVYANGSGNFSFGRATFLQRYALPDERRLQFIDNFSYTTGKHAFKFGGEANRVHDFINNPTEFGGVYTYPSTYALGEDLVTPGAKDYSSFIEDFGIAEYAYNTIDFALFAQDQWRPTHRLTVNYGLRWDKQTMPKPFAPNPAVPLTQKFPTDWKSFGPRAGLAYDVTGKGKTVIRGGYGMYYGRIPNGIIAYALQNTGLTDPSKALVSLTLQPTDPNAPVYPNILSAVPTGESLSTTSTLLGKNFSRPRVQDYTIGVQQQLPWRFVLTASYAHTYGDHLEIVTDSNLPAPQFTRTYKLPDGTTFSVPFSAGVIKTAAGATVSVNTARPIPTQGATNVNNSQGQSWYNALILDLHRRLTAGLQVNAAFTWSKAENTAGTGNGEGAAAETAFNGGTPANQFNLAADRGLSPLDQRYRLVTSAVWEPRGRALRGFRFSAIETIDAGRPISEFISSPSVPFLGTDGNQYNGFGGIMGQGTGGDHDLLPSVPRNSISGPANYTLSLRLSREFRFHDRFHVETLLEGFNVFNHSNYNGFNDTLYNATATTATTPLATPVSLTRTAGYLAPISDSSPPDGTNARRLQLAIRFRF